MCQNEAFVENSGGKIPSFGNPEANNGKPGEGDFGQSHLLGGSHYSGFLCQSIE
jgi:hypothetical protein